MQEHAHGDNGEQLITQYSFASPVLISPRIPTCKVATPQLNVSLGMASPADFTGPGSVSRHSQEFRLELDCEKGDAGTSTRAYVSLTDANRPANTTTTLSVRQLGGPESSASGIGVQVLKDGSPVTFGPEPESPRAANQWFAGEVVQGQRRLSIPLAARYVQDGPAVTSGRVQAHATFRISYQ